MTIPLLHYLTGLVLFLEMNKLFFFLPSFQANLILSLSDHNGDLLPAQAKFNVYVHCADSHFHLGKYRKAESLYKKSLQFRKCLLKSKGATKPPTEGHKDLLSDIDIKYQIHLCLVKLKNQHEALQVLQSIPGKQRTAKVKLALDLMSNSVKLNLIVLFFFFFF